MNTKIMKYSLTILLAVCILLTGCATPKPSALSDEQVVQVADNLLKSIDIGDYQAFSRDFSDAMKAAFPESSFSDMQALLQKASGKYASCGQPSLLNSQGYAVYRLICKYELEDVVVTISIKVDGDKVDGLFFDSPNLRNASK
jgi:hypothetical protein